MDPSRLCGRGEPVMLWRGALSDVEAKLLLMPQIVPYLWALGDDLAVTLPGGLTRSELVRVAEPPEPGA